MRAFNQREKEIIKKLTQQDLANTEFFSFFLQNNYFTEENKRALFVITKINTALLYLEKQVFDDLPKRKEELGKLYELISLILYLKENRYISIYSNPGFSDSDLHVMHEGFDNIRKSGETKVLLNNNGNYFHTSSPEFIYNKKDEVSYVAVNLEREVYNLIAENFMGLLYVSEELVELSKRNFKSEEEIRFKKQQIATWFSISIAFILGILGFLTQKGEAASTTVINNNSNFYDTIENNDLDFNGSHDDDSINLHNSGSKSDSVHDTIQK